MDRRTLTDKDGRKIGERDSNGTTYDKYGQKTSTEREGVIQERDGRIISRIDNDGRISDRYGRTIGYRDSDGTTRDRDGHVTSCES
jgi:hypothetical protein